MASRGEQSYGDEALERVERARAARVGVALAGGVLALLGPGVVWLRVAKGVPFGWWAVVCLAAAGACLGAVGLARAGRTRRGLALIVCGVVLVVAGDLVATATA